MKKVFGIIITKLLTGIRRCGKSTILKMIMEELKKRDIPNERILSYRFDSMKYEDTQSLFKITNGTKHNFAN